MLSVGRDLYFITLKLLARCFSPACARRSITMRNLLLLQSSSEKLCGHLVWPWANQLYLRCQVGDLAAEEQVHVRGILFCVRARARRIQTKPLSQGSSTSLSPPQSPSSCTLVAVVSGFACSCANTFAEFFNRLPRTRASCAKPELAAMVWPLAPRALPREHRGSQMGKSGPQRIFFPERVALKSFICC